MVPRAPPLRWRVGYALQLVQRSELVLQVAAVVAGIERHAAGALDEFRRVFGAAPLPNALAQPSADGARSPLAQAPLRSTPSRHMAGTNMAS